MQETCQDEKTAGGGVSEKGGGETLWNGANFFGIQGKRVAMYLGFRHTTKAANRLQSQMRRTKETMQICSGTVFAYMRNIQERIPWL